MEPELEDKQEKCYIRTFSDWSFPPRQEFQCSLQERKEETERFEQNNYEVARGFTEGFVQSRLKITARLH